MKKFILLALGASVLCNQGFAADVLMTSKQEYPITIEQAYTHHDGEDFKSFCIRQGSGVCRHIGKAQEVPVKFFKEEIRTQNEHVFESGLADVGVGAAAALLPEVPAIGAGVNSLIGALQVGFGGQLLAQEVIATGLFGAGSVGTPMLVKNMSPRQHLLRARAASSAASGSQVTLKNNKDVLAFSKQLEIVLDNYDTRSRKRMMIDDFNEALDNAHEERAKLAQICNDAIDVVKTLSPTEAGRKNREAIKTVSYIAN